MNKWPFSINVDLFFFVDNEKQEEKHIEFKFTHPSGINDLIELIPRAIQELTQSIKTNHMSDTKKEQPDVAETTETKEAKETREAIAEKPETGTGGEKTTTTTTETKTSES